MNSKQIENIRRVMGTLPSEKPNKQTNIINFDDSCEVTLEDSSENPYKSMFVSATSTWGDNNFKQKWPVTSLEGKLEVLKAVLTHNTLPQAREMIQFVFRIKGVQRWLFDYHTQTVQFISFMSIGCRDNNKIDCDIVNDYHDNIDIEIFDELKDLYELALSDNHNQGSWQSARSFLPQSYSHSYHFGQNLLSIISTRGFNAQKGFNYEDKRDYTLARLYKKIQAEISKKFPLIGLYLNILFEDNEKIFEKIRSLEVKHLSKLDIELLNKI